jgi:hypothetical protein
MVVTFNAAFQNAFALVTAPAWSVFKGGGEVPELVKHVFKVVNDLLGCVGWWVHGGAVFGGEGLLRGRNLGEQGYGLGGSAGDGIGEGAMPPGGEGVEVFEGLGIDSREVMAAAFAGGSGSGGALAGLACGGKLGMGGGGGLWLAHGLIGFGAWPGGGDSPPGALVW